jgi:hypothetical protein
MQCQTNRLRYLSRAYIIQTIKILEKKMYKLNYELQRIFVVATLRKQTMSKEVENFNKWFSVAIYSCKRKIKKSKSSLLSCNNVPN